MFCLSHYQVVNIFDLPELHVYLYYLKSPIERENSEKWVISIFLIKNREKMRKNIKHGQF